MEPTIHNYVHQKEIRRKYIMKLRDYLTEESHGKVRVVNNKVNAPQDDRGSMVSVNIPKERNVILMGDKPKPTKTVMIYIDKNTGKITTMDNKNNIHTWSNDREIEQYLNKEGFVYFEGYNRF